MLQSDLQNAQSPEHIVPEQWTGSGQIPGFMECGEMRQMGVLQRRSGLIVKLRSIGAQDQQGDGQLVELHG
jgi:hypothetical protein